MLQRVLYKFFCKESLWEKRVSYL